MSGSQSSQDEGASLGGEARALDELPAVVGAGVDGGAFVGGTDPAEDAMRFLQRCAPVVAAADIEEGRADPSQAGRIVDAEAGPEARPGEADPALDAERRRALHNRRSTHRRADQEDAFGARLSRVGDRCREILSERERVPRG
jgi:hypothetical protein